MLNWLCEEGFSSDSVKDSSSRFTDYGRLWHYRQQTPISWFQERSILVEGCSGQEAMHSGSPVVDQGKEA